MDNFLENYELAGEKLKIITYPSPVLAKKAQAVENFDDNFKALVKNMLYTMYKTPGIGLAGPQVNHSLRFFVMDVDYTKEDVVDSDGDTTVKLENFSPQVIINPTFKSKEGTITHEEGCLSLPGFFEDITRFENIVIEYHDINGIVQTKEASGLEAICLQHEFDHLEGIVFIDHLSLLKKKFIRNKLIKEKKRQ